MPTTPYYGLRYPAGSDTANGPVAVGNLASDVDTLLKAFAVNVASSTAGAGTSTLSSSFVATPLSVTLTTTGGLVLVFVSGSATCSLLGALCQFGISMDGGAYFTVSKQSCDANGAYFGFGGLVYEGTPAAGAHTFTLGIETSGGTLTLDSTAPSLVAVELKR